MVTLVKHAVAQAVDRKRIRPHFICKGWVVLGKPFLGVRCKAKHCTRILNARAAWVKQNAARVGMPQKRAAKPRVEYGVKPRFLHHVAVHQKIVHQGCVFVEVAAADVVFTDGGAQKACFARVAGVVGHDDRLGVTVHQIRTDVFDGGLQNRRMRARLVFFRLRHAIPVVAQIKAFAPLKARPFGCVGLAVFVEKRIGAFRFLRTV